MHNNYTVISMGFYSFSSHCKPLWNQELFVESLTYLAEKVSSRKLNMIFNTTFIATVMIGCLQTAACRHKSGIRKSFLYLIFLYSTSQSLDQRHLKQAERSTIYNLEKKASGREQRKWNTDVKNTKHGVRLYFLSQPQHEMAFY